MQSHTLPARRLVGVEVRLDLSALVLVGLVAWAFTSLFRSDHELPVALTMAAVGSLLVLLTTLAHELGHALEARYRGMEVEAITLLLFGGVTEMHADGQTARDELAVAAVGPWVSLVCAAVFGLLATMAGDLLPTTVAGPVAQVAGVLGWWNLLLAVFNLVPGAPLDGGRVLRALLWMLLGDRLRALRISVRAGQLMGVVLIVLGIATLVRGGPRASLVVAAFALSGVFLIRAAATELTQAELGAALEGRRVVDLLAAPPAPLDADQRLDGLDRQQVAEGGDLHAVRRDGELLGVVERARLLDDDDHGGSVDALLGEVTEPLDEVPGVELTDDIHTLIDAFQGDHHVVRIVRDGRTIGALTEREVARAIARLRRGGTA